MRNTVSDEYHGLIDIFENTSLVKKLSSCMFNAEEEYETYAEHPTISFLATPFNELKTVTDIIIRVEAYDKPYWIALITHRFKEFHLESQINQFSARSDFFDTPQECIDSLSNKLLNYYNVLNEKIATWQSVKVDISEKNQIRRGANCVMFSENNDKHRKTHRFDFQKNKKGTDWSVYSFVDPQCFGRGKNPTEAWDDMISFAKQRQELMKSLHNLMKNEEFDE